mmetsp:Transcript_3240/g.3774  ORF Transcript_3240/g.3774 Transcript_3240/m.3774 type:complete len:284 (+) Transcript_3240:142-993(+)
MVKIAKRRNTRLETFKSTNWFVIALFLTICGFTGTLTLFFPGKISKSKGGLKGSTGSMKPIVSALSASTMVENGRPYLVYGTAWKEERTAILVAEAIRSGFRFIDTACQPKHYNEAGVGDGIVTAMKELNLSRDDIFIQTKFTSLDGQDPNRIPYDEDAELEEQIEQSVETSLMNLKTTYLDSLVMHSPEREFRDTMRVWRVFESVVDSGKVRNIGISNCYDFHKFRRLYDAARIKPSFLQNRFYAQSGFDIELREFCEEHGILYQSFWTLSLPIEMHFVVMS